MGCSQGSSEGSEFDDVGISDRPVAILCIE